jgi:putative nucleotidyltransferase with HDIG domain
VLRYLEGLADEVDLHHREPGLSLAMLELAAKLCEALGLDPPQRRRCLVAARLHDIGKIGVPKRILGKAGPLTDEEWSVMREHVRLGVDMLLRCPETRDAAAVVADHHERPDGRGYPAGKSGAEISVEAGIVSVLDAWTAMLAEAPYKRRRSPQEAERELLSGRGTQFDVHVVDALLRIVHAEAGTPHAA